VQFQYYKVRRKLPPYEEGVGVVETFQYYKVRRKLKKWEIKDQKYKEPFQYYKVRRKRTDGKGAPYT